MISRNRKHGFLATAHQSLPNSTEVRSSRKIEPPDDLTTCHSLTDSVSVPLIEALFELSSSSHKVCPVVTNDCVRSPTSCHEPSNRHHACTSVQSIHHFYVNCSTDQTCEQTTPVLHWSTQNSNFKWAKIIYSSILERIYFTLCSFFGKSAMWGWTGWAASPLHLTHLNLMLPNTFRSPITQNRCWTRLLTYSVPSWWLSSCICINIRITVGCLAESRIGCFKSSRIVALLNRPFNRFMLSLSINGESLAKSCFTLSLPCHLQVFWTARQNYHVVSSSGSSTQLSVFSTLPLGHVALI